jgi:hypothetical protein
MFFVMRIKMAKRWTGVLGSANKNGKVFMRSKLCTGRYSLTQHILQATWFDYEIVIVGPFFIIT